MFTLLVALAGTPAIAGASSPAAQSAEDVQARLRPTIKPASELRTMARQAAARGTPLQLLTKPLTSTLELVLMLDSSTSMSYASPSTLTSGGLQQAQALDIARKNLEAVPATVEPIGPGVWLSATGDGYDCARMVSLERLRALGIQGDPVVLLLAQDRAFATSADDPAGVAALLRIAAASIKDDLARPVSIVPIVHHDGAWQDLRLPAEHPAHADVAQLVRLQHGQWVYEQHRDLEAHPVPGKVYVSQLSAVRAPTGALFLATLEPGPTLLPEADQVAILDPEGTPHLVPWATFLRVAGPHLKPEPGTHPPLLRADGVAILGDLTALSKVWLSVDEAMLAPRRLGE